MSKSASTAADDLEGLSNTDLRAKCVEYGLPNVPITDTSRKLLIRRLRAAMEGGGGGDSKATAAKAKSSRRETIHVVTKTVEPERETSPKKSRATRRTIAAPSEPEEEPTVEVSIRQIATNRRRSRTTPTPASEPTPVPVVAAKRKAAAIVEDDEDESDSDIQIVEDKRSSRSPSLSKSKTVTTSYKHVIAEEPIVEEPAYKPRETYIPVRREAAYEPPRVAESYLSRPTTQQLSRPSLGTTSSSYTTQSSSATRRYTTSGGYKPQSQFTTSNVSTHSYKPQSSLTAYRHNVAENSEDYEEEEEEEDLNAPFLSDFARRLSRLKPEPLVSNKLDREAVSRDTQRYYTTSTSIGGRRGINNRDSLV